MPYKKYKGKDKYHIRIRKRTGHPSIITLEDGNYLIGYDTTTSYKKYRSHRPFFHKLESKLTNKNVIQNKSSYVYKIRMKDKKNGFSKPYNNSHLTDKDEAYIDFLESRYKK